MKRESHESSFQLAGVSRPFGKVSAGVGIASHLNHLVASFRVPSLPGLLISYTSYIMYHHYLISHFHQRHHNPPLVWTIWF
jgi:hypothetical protein